MSDAWASWLLEYQKAGDGAQIAMSDELSGEQKRFLMMTLPRQICPPTRSVNIVAFFSFLAVLFCMVFIALYTWFLWFPC